MRIDKFFVAGIMSLLVAVAAANTAPTVRKASDPDSQVLHNINSQDLTNSEEVPVQDIERFSSTLSHIKNYYIEEPKDTKLFESAIRGMLNGLDPHSDYLDEEEFRDLQITTSGEYGGLGIEITQNDGFIRVVSPIDDTPAFKAGVKAGDLIIKLNGKSIRGITLRDAVKKMRGKIGAKIVLTVFRKGAKKSIIDIPITRDKIVINTVKSKLIDKHYGYVRISHFQEPTDRDMLKAVRNLRKQSGNSLKGLILDLRNNPGGLLDSAINVSDAFIHNDKKGKEELIVFTKGRAPGSKYVAKAKPGDMLKGAPIVVLINNGSASGSEIVAGALQDHNRAVVMGTKSFGKGSVQTVLPLDSKTAVKLTTARYYTPHGRAIQAKGISPDIIVEDIQFKDVQDALKKEGRLSEADLLGHLEEEGGTAKDGNKKASKAAKNKKSVSVKHHEDYQLFEAVNLLKGLAVLREQKRLK